MTITTTSHTNADKFSEVEGPCTACANMASRQQRPHNSPAVCDHCKKLIPRTSIQGEGCYESADPHHYHWCLIFGREAWMPVMEELCLECYRIDYAKKFPGFQVQA